MLLAWIRLLFSLSGMKRRKKSCDGDVRAGALSWSESGDKCLKTSFCHLSPLSAMVVSRRSPLTSPPPEEKSRFAKKKSASPKKTAPAENGRRKVCGRLSAL